MCRDLGSCIILFDEVLMILPIWPFPGCGGRRGCGRCPKLGPRCVRAPPCGVCPAGGLQCALLVLVPVGAVGLSWPGGGLFWPVGEGRLCVPGFMLLVGFGGALLVVSVLGIVCDCYWGPLLPKSRARRARAAFRGLSRR